MTFANLIPSALSFLILLSNICFLVALALFIFSEKMRVKITAHLAAKPLEHIFIVSLLATLGSLSLSNIVGFPPCDLCWFSRIMMYPQLIVSFVALFRKSKVHPLEVVYMLLPLSVIGGIISLFQSYVQWTGSSSLLSCTLNGGACGKLYIYAYNYLTIPFMAFSMFAYLIALSLVALYGKK